MNTHDKIYDAFVITLEMMNVFPDKEEVQKEIQEGFKKVNSSRKDIKKIPVFINLYMKSSVEDRKRLSINFYIKSPELTELTTMFLSQFINVENLLEITTEKAEEGKINEGLYLFGCNAIGELHKCKEKINRLKQ